MQDSDLHFASAVDHVAKTPFFAFFPPAPSAPANFHEDLPDALNSLAVDFALEHGLWKFAKNIIFFERRFQDPQKTEYYSALFANRARVLGVVGRELMPNIEQMSSAVVGLVEQTISKGPGGRECVYGWHLKQVG